MWNGNLSISTLSRLPQLLLLYPFLGIAGAMGMDTAQFLKAELVTIWALTGIFMFYTSRYLLEEKGVGKRIDPSIAAIMAGVIYAWNGFGIAHMFHPFMRIAIALAPILLLTLYIGFSRGKVPLVILGGLLWCLMCGGVHWMVYGGILSFIVLVYFLIKDYLENKGAPRRVLLRGWGSHIGLFMLLLVSFVLFSSYWLLPGYAMGNTSLYGNIITHETLDSAYRNMDLGSLISLDASQLVTPRMFESENPFLSSSSMVVTISLMGFFLLAFALTGFLFPDRRGLKTLFLTILVIAYAQSLLMVYWPEGGTWLVLKAPLNGLYGWSFRTPKFVQFIFLAVAFLLAFSVHDVLSWLRRRRFSSIVSQATAISVIAIVVISITLPNWPMATGDYNGNLYTVDLPGEFDQVFDWLDDQEGDFKVLWVPDYRSTQVDWNQGLRTNKDIIALSSPRPTYYFDDRHTQPNGYGIYFLESLFSPDHRSSLLYENSTDDLGKMLYPLGIRYVIFHDDNATTRGNDNELLEDLNHQSDMVLAKRAGMLYVFENTYEQPGQDGALFAVTNEVLVYGGLSSLDSLHSIPGYDPSKSIAIFGDQTLYDIKDLRGHIDTIVWNGEPDLDQIALSFIDRGHIVRPFDAIDHSGRPSTLWSKEFIEDMTLPSITRKSGSMTRDWAYDGNFVYTWGEGTPIGGPERSQEVPITEVGFEDGIGPFDADNSDFQLNLSERSSEGHRSLRGEIAPGPADDIVLEATSYLLNIGRGQGTYRVSLDLAASAANAIQVRLNFLDGSGEKLDKVFLLTRTGDFDFTELAESVDLSSNFETIELSVLAERHPANVSEWWMDDVRVTYERRETDPNRLDLPFSTSQKGDHELYIRSLQGQHGGRLDLSIDGEYLADLITRGEPTGFFWTHLGTVPLSKGSHKLQIDNVEGFNAVNLVAVVPSMKMEEHRRSVSEMIDRTTLVQTIEVEDVLDRSSSSTRRDHGNDASNGATLRVKHGGAARMPVRLLTDEDVSIFVRTLEDLSNSELLVSIEDKSWSLGSDDMDENGWIAINGIDLDMGSHLLVIENMATPPVLFREDFDGDEAEIWTRLANWSDLDDDFEMTVEEVADDGTDHYLRLSTSITENGTRSGLKSEEIPIKSPIDLVCKISVRSENINPSHTKIQGLNSTSGIWEQLEILGRVKGDTGWKEFSKEVHVPGEFESLRFLLNGGTSEDPAKGNGTIWFDDVTVIEQMESGHVDLDVVHVVNGDAILDVADAFHADGEASVQVIDGTDANSIRFKVTSQGPITIVLRETYDDMWTLKGHRGGPVNSVPVNGMLNGFMVNVSGTNTFTIEYRPQVLYEIGMTVTVLSIIIFPLYVLAVTYRRERLTAIYERLHLPRFKNLEE
jgi:hypothetical protein